jgi:cysteinyl-tRNA synthetase
MDDDFNISGALGTVFEFISQVNQQMGELRQKDAAAILAYLERLNTVLGVLQLDDASSLAADIEAKIAQREKARQEKDFKKADAIRAELKQKGITLLDTPGGVKWKKE